MTDSDMAAKRRRLEEIAAEQDALLREARTLLGGENDGDPPKDGNARMNDAIRSVRGAPIPTDTTGSQRMNDALRAATGRGAREGGQ